MFQKIKNDILGKEYSLSIAFVDAQKMQEVNKKYRKKNKPTNILSFPFSKTEGEILLCEEVIKKEVKERVKTEGRTYKKWLGFLVIHGMLHLKGYEHSSKMERLEQEYDQKHFHRYRHGNDEHARVRGRIRKGRKKS
jgi:rRNA maturation RNase YbeY